MARARRIDPVVSQHYSDFGERTSVSELTSDELVYVSYRKKNKVYWTKTKHRVCKGEAILTDGKNQARSRCGNRLSKTPKLPTTNTEPTESSLNGPDVPLNSPGGPNDAGGYPGSGITPGNGDGGSGPANTGAGTGDTPGQVAGLTGDIPKVATGATGDLGPGIASYPIATPYYGLAGLVSSPNTSGGGGSGSTGGTTPVTPVVPITAIPEPSALALLVAGAMALFTFRKRRS